MRDNVKFVKAGVGGTPSELGMLRFDRDVLRDGEKPDIVVVEFAVNDEGDETKGDCYESLVRKILKLDWNPAVVLLFSVFANDWNLQDRLSPVGRLYDLPNGGQYQGYRSGAVYRRNRTRKGSDKKSVLLRYVSSDDLGHTIMADCLQYLFERCDLSEHCKT